MSGQQRLPQRGLFPQGAHESRRYLALSLPLWATDCLKRADPALAAATIPLALYERQKGAMRLVELNARARATGLFAGQSLSDARALCPGLRVQEIDRAALEAVFADFADWHSYASPIVSVISDGAAYGDLAIDITGVTHLFGGEAQMLASVTGRLRGLGFTVDAAIAGSVGAAWGLSHFAPGQIVSDSAAALEALPVAALRLTEPQISGLMQMGLKRVGQLYARDRKALQARFGASLLLRLDQALGFVEERIRPRLPQAERYAERRFADPIGLIDDVLMCAHDLAVQLGLALEAEGLGAQRFTLFLYRIDHKVITLGVNASRATRDPGHISRLFANRAERLAGEYDAGFGIDMVRLAADTVADLNPVQIGAFETRDGTADLDRLYDRMASRLGAHAIVRSKFVNTWQPERAVQLEPVISRTPDDPLAAAEPALPRPIRLLPEPEPIGVIMAEVPDGPPRGMVWRRIRYNFVRASGPERIGAEWGGADFVLSARVTGRDNAPGEALIARAVVASRDYYLVEDREGARFWLFREGLYSQTENPGWFVHGIFA